MHAWYQNKHSKKRLVMKRNNNNYACWSVANCVCHMAVFIIHEIMSYLWGPRDIWPSIAIPLHAGVPGFY